MLAQIDEAIACGGQAYAHRPAVVAAIRIPEDLEVLAVVQFEQFGDQVGSGVLVKIGRQIADAQLWLRNPLMRERQLVAQRGERLETGAREFLRTAVLLLGAARGAQKRKRR